MSLTGGLPSERVALATLLWNVGLNLSWGVLLVEID